MYPWNGLLFLHSYTRLEFHQTVSLELPCLQGLLILCNCFQCHWPNQLTAPRSTALICVSSEELTKINSRSFLSTGASLRAPRKQMSRDYPIPVERLRLSLFVCEFALLPRKCQVFLDRSVVKCWMTGQHSACIDTLEVFCYDSRWCLSPPGCGSCAAAMAISASQDCVCHATAWIAKFQVNWDCSFARYAHCITQKQMVSYSMYTCRSG